MAKQGLKGQNHLAIIFGPKYVIIVATLIVYASMTTSRVARGGGYNPLSIGMLTKMRNKENTTFLALLRLSFALE